MALTAQVRDTFAVELLLSGVFRLSAFPSYWDTKRPGNGEHSRVGTRSTGTIRGDLASAWSATQSLLFNAGYTRVHGKRRPN